jgi:hypothetical protein
MVSIKLDSICRVVCYKATSLCHESQTETTQHKTREVLDKRITPDYKPDVGDVCGCEQVLLEDKATLRVVHNEAV